MKKIIILCALVCFLAVPQVFSETVVGYDGPFMIHPQTPMHKADMTGKMNLLFEGGNFTLVRLDLDNPVLGQTIYQSKEQVMNVIPRSETLSQLSVIYKLERPTHKWYFVAVANSTSGSPFEGTIYKVNDTLEVIQALLKAGFDTAPANWKSVGMVTLTAH